LESFAAARGLDMQNAMQEVSEREVARLYRKLEYLSFIAATAPMEKLRQLTRPLGIAHEIRNRIGDSMEYDVDHSAAIVLVNPDAEFAGLFGAPQDAGAMARDMTRIVEHN